MALHCQPGVQSPSLGNRSLALWLAIAGQAHARTASWPLSTASHKAMKGGCRRVRVHAIGTTLRCIGQSELNKPVAAGSCCCRRLLLDSGGGLSTFPEPGRTSRGMQHPGCCGLKPSAWCAGSLGQDVRGLLGHGVGAGQPRHRHAHPLCGGPAHQEGTAGLCCWAVHLLQCTQPAASQWQLTRWAVCGSAPVT